MAIIINDGVLVKYASEEEFLTIPEEVEKISSEAIKDCSNLRAIFITKNIIVESEAIKNCSALEKISLPAGGAFFKENAIINCPIRRVFYNCERADNWPGIKNRISKPNEILLKAIHLFPADGEQKPVVAKRIKAYNPNFALYKIDPPYNVRVMAEGGITTTLPDSFNGIIAVSEINFCGLAKGKTGAHNLMAPNTEKIRIFQCFITPKGLSAGRWELINQEEINAAYRSARNAQEWFS